MSSALRSPGFRRLWLAGLVSDTGDWFLFIAMPLVVLRLTGSAAGASFAFLLELAPAVVLAPVAARLATRIDRRRLMVWTNVGQAVVLLPLLFVHTAAELPVAYAVIAAHAALAAVFEPAKNSLLPDLVAPDRLVSANALVGLNQNLGRLIGGPLGGIVLALGGLSLVVTIDAVSFLVSAALIGSLAAVMRRMPERALSADDDSTPGGVLAALRIPALRPVFLIIGMSSIAQGMFLVLFLLFVTGPLHGSDADVGLLRGVQAVGAIAAGLALGLLARTAGPRSLTVASVLSFGLVSLLTWNLPAITTQMWPYVVLFALIGAPGVVMIAGAVSVIQSTARPRDLPAVFAALGLVSAVTQAAGILLAGLAGIPGMLLPLLDVQAGLYLAAGLVGLLWLRTRRRAEPELSRPSRSSRRSAAPVRRR